jgi:hypothetical protein
MTKKGYRKFGNRKLKVREDDVQIAARDEWVLVKVTAWCQNGWTSLKLYRDAVGPKNLWQIGVKGDRVARNKDAGLLSVHHPDVIEWIVKSVEEHNGEGN